MAVAEDVLATRLEVLGLAEYSSKIAHAVRALGVFREGADHAAAKQLGIGLALTTAGVGIAAKLVEMAKLAGEEDAAFRRASEGFRAHGHSFPTEELEKFSAEMQRATGVSKVHVASFVGILGQYGATREQAERLAPGILNVAEAMKAQGGSAEGLAMKIGRALQSGDLGKLARDLPINQVKFQTDAVGALFDALQRKGGDSAAVFRRSLPGALQASSSAFESLQANIGKTFEGPMAKAINITTDIVNALNEVPGATTAIGIALAGIAGVTIVAGLATAFAAAQNVWLTRTRLLEADAARKQAIEEAKLAGVLGTQGVAGGVAGGARGGIRGRGGGILRGILGTGLAIGGASIHADMGDHSWKAFGKRLGAGAAEGVGVGMMFGGPGALIGGAAGLAKGAIDNIISGFSKRKPGEAHDPLLEQMKKAVEHLAGIDDAVQKGAMTGMDIGSAPLQKALGEARLRAIVRNPTRELARNLA